MFAGFFVRSYWAADQFAFSAPSYILGVSNDATLTYFYFGKRWMLNRDGDGLVHRSAYPTIRPVDRIYVEWVIFAGDAWGSSYRGIAVPTWKLFALTLLAGIRLPLRNAEAAIRRRIAIAKEPKSGKCRACGYDLRATPCRCPECGTVPLAQNSLN